MPLGGVLKLRRVQGVALTPVLQPADSAALPNDSIDMVAMVGERAVQAALAVVGMVRGYGGGGAGGAAVAGGEGGLGKAGGETARYPQKVTTSSTAMSLSAPMPRTLKHKQLDPTDSIDTACQLEPWLPLLLHSTAPEAAFTRSVP